MRLELEFGKYIFCWGNLILFPIVVGYMALLLFLFVNKKYFKLLHVVLTSAATGLFIFLFNLWGIPWWISPCFFALTGFPKELYDMIRYHEKFEWLDILYSLAGAGVVAIFYLLNGGIK